MMRRSSSKKAASVAASGSKGASKEQDKADTLFANYAESGDSDMIGPDGVERLCQDLGVSPADIKILIFAWKLQASRMGYFTKEEWRQGLKAMKVDSLDKLRKALPALQSEVASPYVFRDFYTFAFQYCLTEPRQKTLDIETAGQMLQLVLAHYAHLPPFLQYLNEQKDYKAVNLDQWTALLRFCEEVKSDLSNYDENQAWPLLLDNYVEWARQQRTAN